MCNFFLCFVLRGQLWIFSLNSFNFQKWYCWIEAEKGNVFLVYLTSITRHLWSLSWTFGEWIYMCSTYKFCCVCFLLIFSLVWFYRLLTLEIKSLYINLHFTQELCFIDWRIVRYNLILLRYLISVGVRRKAEQLLDNDDDTIFLSFLRRFLSTQHFSLTVKQKRTTNKPANERVSRDEGVKLCYWNKANNIFPSFILLFFYLLSKRYKLEKAKSDAWECFRVRKTPSGLFVERTIFDCVVYVPIIWFSALFHGINKLNINLTPPVKA